MRGTVVATVLAAAAGGAAVAFLALPPTAGRPGEGSRGAPGAGPGPGLADVGGEPQGERPSLSSRGTTAAEPSSPTRDVRPTPEEEEWLAAVIAYFDSYSGGDRLRVLESLRRMGPRALAAVPTLVARLGTDDLRMRKALARALGAVGGEALPTIVAATAHADPLVRAGAIRALGIAVATDVQAGTPPSAEALAAFVSALRDPDEEVRSSAAVAVRSLGPDQGAVVEALLAGLSDPAHAVRAAAADAMAFRVASGEAVRAVPLLAARVDLDDSEVVRETAARAIPAFGDDAAPAVPSLVRAARGDSILVAREALESLRRMGRSAAASVSDLLGLARLEDEEVRLRAGWALAHVAPDDPEVVALFEGWLPGSDPDLWSAALSGLAWAGSAGAAALARVAGDPERAHVFDHAAVGLPESHGADPKAVLASLTALLARDEEALICLGLRSLGEIGEEGFPSEDEMFRCLSPVLAAVRSGKTPKVRRTALETSTMLGPEESARFRDASKPAIVAALGDPDPSVRLSAFEAFGRLGVSRAEAVRISMPLLADGSEDVRAAALLALLGAGGPSFDEALERMAKDDPSPRLRSQAAQLLETLRGKSGPNALSLPAPPVPATPVR